MELKKKIPVNCYIYYSDSLKKLWKYTYSSEQSMIRVKLGVCDSYDLWLMVCITL